MPKKTLITNLVIALASLAILFLAFNSFFFIGDRVSTISKVDKETALMEEGQFAKQFFVHIQAHDFETVKPSVDPKVINPASLLPGLTATAKFFPNESAKSLKFLGWRNLSKDGNQLYTIVFLEYEFLNKWIFASATLQKRGKDFAVLGWNVTPIKDSVENLAKFNFAGQDIKHYAVFTVAILLLLFNIYVLALCIKELVLRPKSFTPWLWTIFVFVGFAPISFSWLNGMFNYFTSASQTFFGNSAQGYYVELFHIPVAWFSLSAYQPLEIGLTVPLGAILFLLTRKIFASSSRRNETTVEATP